MNKKTWIWVGVAVVVIVVIAVIAMGNTTKAPASNTEATSGTQTAAPNQPAGNSSAPYMSAADNFSVNFSGTPTVSNMTYDSPTAGTIPLTEYKVTSDASAGAYYGVYVYHYPASYQFSSDYFDGALKAFAAAIDAKFTGTTIASESQTEFLGDASLAGTITLPEGTEYALVTTKGQNAYIISSYGVSQSDYTTFLNSFTFTQ